MDSEFLLEDGRKAEKVEIDQSPDTITEIPYVIESSDLLIP